MLSKFSCIAIPLAVVLCFFTSATGRPTRCLPVGELPETLEGSTPIPGEYKLTLFATSGEKKGAVVDGELRLIQTSENDVSPVTGERVALNEDRSKMPLYGSVFINFRAVDAPVSECDQYWRVDPIYPDVLVRVISFKGIKKQPVVVICSEGNRRDGGIVKDGSGIGLFVQEIDKEGFAGIWDRWGKRTGGSGHFCARFVEELAE